MDDFDGKRRRIDALLKEAGDIPNIDLVAIYEGHLARSGVQHETVGRMAELMGLEPVPHRHDDCVQIHFMERGHLDLRLDNVSYTGEAPIVFLTPPAVPHAFAMSADSAGHVLTSRQDLLWQLARENSLLPDREQLHPFCVSLSDTGDMTIVDDIRAGFQLLEREFRATHRNGDTGVRSLAGYILSKVLSVRPQMDRPQSQSLGRLALYRRFLELVEEHFAAHWPLTRYAEQMHVTQSRLYDICHDGGALPPKAIISNRVIQEARRYLAFSNASIKEIAAALGFEDSAYFFRFFRRMTGDTPTDYRNRVRRVNLENGSAPAQDTN